jgi:hypothetical protein
MVVKVFINMKGSDKGGTYEVDEFPPQAANGFVTARRIVKKDGSKHNVLLALTDISRIEQAGDDDQVGL